MHSLLIRLLPLLLVAAAPVREPVSQPFEVMRSADLRLATIAHRLTTANLALCRSVAPAPGLVLHAADQYDPALRSGLKSIFGFDGPVSVEAVVQGSAAERAGIEQNDSITAVAGVQLAPSAEGATRASSATRDAAVAAIARQPLDAGLSLELVRAGARLSVPVPPSPGCASRFEILLGRGLIASADGSLVQIGMRFFEAYDDTEIAVVIAHELSHNILRHRVRLEAAGVKRGLLAEVGRNGRLFRRSETDADLLSVSLLRNAGYDPNAAVRFWREHGDAVGGGFFRSRTHASAGARAKAIAAEIAAIPATAPTPYLPAILGTRDRPLE